MIAQILAEEILADSSQNRQSAKINSLPKFPAIRYGTVGGDSIYASLDDDGEYEIVS